MLTFASPTKNTDFSRQKQRRGFSFGQNNKIYLNSCRVYNMGNPNCDFWENSIESDTVIKMWEIYCRCTNPNVVGKSGKYANVTKKYCDEICKGKEKEKFEQTKLF